MTIRVFVVVPIFPRIFCGFGSFVITRYPLLQLPEVLQVDPLPISLPATWQRGRALGVDSSADVCQGHRQKGLTVLLPKKKETIPTSNKQPCLCIAELICGFGV